MLRETCLRVRAGMRSRQHFRESGPAWGGTGLIADEILQTLVLLLLIASACLGWQIQDVLNRCHNAFQDPMDTRQAQGSPASPIWRPMRSAWLRADRLGRSFQSRRPGGRDIWPWPRAAVKMETECLR